MMVKVQIKRQTETIEEVEVEFPIFYCYGDIFDEGGGYDTECRIDADGFEATITRRQKRGGDIEWEFSKDRADAGYVVGRLNGPGWSSYERSTAEAFGKMHADALEALQALRSGVVRG